MEPRTRILFISYIVIVLLIVGIGVVPYFVRGDYKRDVPAEPQAVGAVVDDTNFVGTVHIINTNKNTHYVRFQLPQDGVVFEEKNDRLYDIMKGRNGRDIVISYKKMAAQDGNTYYNFTESLEVLPNR